MVLKIPGKTSTQSHLKILTDAVQAGAFNQIRLLTSSLHPAEIAHLLESTPHGPRELLWEIVNAELHGEILIHVNDEVRAGLISELETEELVAATEGLATDDLADLISDLPGAVIHEVLRSMDNQNRQRLESVLTFPEDTAGGLMNLDMVTVRADVTLDVVQRYLRQLGSIPDSTDSLIVVDRFDHYLGILPLTILLTADEELRVDEVMNHDADSIHTDIADIEVAKLFEKRDLISAAVINNKGKLLGRITIDDVVDVIRDEADHSLMSMAGLDEEDDIFAPVVHTTKRRALWLGVNLFTAFLASWVIGQFEMTLQKFVALAVLMPVVASMGGIAGSQTLTIVIRGMALGKIGDSNAKQVMIKELLVSCLNGIIWSLVVAVVTVIWFQSLDIGIVIAVAIMINLIAAGIAGFFIPIGLQRAGIDPALAGTVLLTTVTDVIGFVTFLGLGALYLT